MLCDELDIDPRTPITFSDTRFPQFSYNTLRNFLQVYIGLVKQLKEKDVAKKGKDLAVNRNLKAINPILGEGGGGIFTLSALYRVNIQSRGTM